jgi:hypothetical protein
MSRKAPPPPLCLTREEVTIRVRAFGSDTWIPGWIEDGWLDTPSGPPARSVEIEVGPYDSETQRIEDYNAAFAALRRRKYSRVSVRYNDGTRSMAYAL